MTEQIEHSIVRIQTPGGRIIGTGFLIAEEQVRTCAHVIAAALGLPDGKLQNKRGCGGRLLGGRQSRWRVELHCQTDLEAREGRVKEGIGWTLI